MKTTGLLQSSRRNRALVVSVQLIALGLFMSRAHAGNTWDGGAGTGNWGDGNNWNADGAPGYGALVFSGSNQTTNINNSITAMNQVNWNGTAAWVMNGSTTLSLYDNGGTQAKLESLGSGGVSINANITFAANNAGPPNPYGEINAVSGNISFTGNTLTVNGSSVNGIKLFGGNGRDVSFANTVSASGKWFGFTSGNSQSATIASGASVTTGDFYVMNGGTLNLAGGSLTSSAVRLGGDFGNTGNQNQALGGTLALTPTTGGVSFSSPINTVSGNTSNALLIDSKNTSGTNTLTSGIFLDSDLKIQQASGGSLSTGTGTFDVKARKLTVDGAGTTTIGQALTSSLGAGGQLVKQGTGTLVLSSTANSYSGTSAASLNANSTQIAGGTLAIAGDGSLGVAPSGAYNNVQFTGSSTLRSDASISLNANRNISIASASTGSFDNNGNTFTISGIVSGSAGNVESKGSGTTIFTGNNTYTGTTIVTSGSLQIGNSGIGKTGTGGVSVKSGGVILGTGTVQGSSFTAESGSTVLAGDTTAQGSYGTLTLTPASGSGSFDFQSGSSVILGLNPGGTGDLLSLDGLSSGTLLFNGTLSITATAYTPMSVVTFNLLNWVNLTTTTFASRYSAGSYGGYLLGNGDDNLGFDLPDISGSGFGWDIGNFTTNGTISTVALVPEPSRALLVLLGLTGLITRRHRDRTRR